MVREIIEMIADAVTFKRDLPLLRIVCNRPEVRHKHAFSKFVACGREELVVDAECRSDVEQY